MAHCPKCGKDLPESANLCLNCGALRVSRPPVSTRVFPLRALSLIVLCLILAATAAALALRPRPVAAAQASDPGEALGSPTAEETEERAAESALPALADEAETSPQEAASSDPAAASAVLPASPDRKSESADGAAGTAAHTHLYQRVVTRASTCTQEGEAEWRCGVCGALEKTETIPCHTTPDGICEICKLYCYQGKSVKLINDLGSSTGNYFLCATAGGYQDFRIISCRFYTAGGALRVSGRAQTVADAAYADTCQAWAFFAGQNQFTTPLTRRTVTVIASGKSGTVDFDAAVADWSALNASGKSGFEIYFADDV